MSTRTSRPPSEDIVCRRVDHHDARDRERALGILREYFASIGEAGAADARYAWLYLANPALAARTFLAADRNTDEVVAITSLFPRPVWVRGQVFLGAIGGDGYVTPRYRRRGIITLLHRDALALMNERDEPVSFMFGPPEPNNLKGLLRAGASLVGHVQRFVRPLGAAGFGARAARWNMPLAKTVPWTSWLLSPRKTKLRLLELGDRPDARVDHIWQRTVDALAGTEQVVPVRDATFYAWRFGSGNGNGNREKKRQCGYLVLDGEEPVAAVALEREDGRVGIIDVTAPPRSLMRAYRAILDACRDADAVHVEVHTPAPWLQAMLFSLGFLPRARKPFQVHVGPHHPAHDALIRPEMWRYMWGDGDVTRVL
ncbi:MAG TPA: GNAT family N-acetyltransferase [Polyangiaceae bacterium]|nr:GNAT family N-acetyltransferase [Polyangiaceae bacterium]